MAKLSRPQAAPSQLWRVAERVASNAPDGLKEIVESATIAQRERDRAEWESAQSEVSDMLDDDLDL